jgi:biotin carboxyl carrier protein
VRYDVEVNGKRRQVTVERRDGRVFVTTADRSFEVDLASAGTNTWSLLSQHSPQEPGSAQSAPATRATIDPSPIQGTRVATHEVVTASDPVSGQLALLVDGVPVTAGLSTRRRPGATDDTAAGAGPQRLVAPMPGKVVRVMARSGDAVQPRQAVVVVEAMKMENELRAARAGTVSELLVREGQSVEAGALLAVVIPD